MWWCPSGVGSGVEDGVGVLAVEWGMVLVLAVE
jgi:hypothetical protein